MAAFTCLGGKVTVDAADVPDATKWTWNPKNETQAYASSDTGGWRKRLPGVYDGSGSWECKAQSATPPVKPGALVSLTLTLATGVAFAAGPAIIDDISTEVDLDTGNIVAWTINFSANGKWDEFD